MENTQKKILFNYFLYLFTFILLCFYGITHASAVTWTNIGDQSNVTVVLVSTSYGDSPYNVPKGSQYNFYNVTAIDIIIDNYNFTANTTYQLEMDFTNQKLINANKYNVYGLNGESCSITYNTEYTRFDGQYPRWAFSCPHSTSTITIEISNSNGGYLWPQQQQNIFTWVYSYLKYTDVSVGGGDNSDIINNQNQNTQDIINNQNQNTQDIINSNKVCTTISKSNVIEFGKYIYNNNTLINDSNFGYTDYINIRYSTMNVLRTGNSNWNNQSYCFYDEDKTLISCSSISSLSLGSLTIPDNAYYFRTSIMLSQDKPQFEYCTNGNQATTDAINDLNDSLNDDDTDGATDEASDFFESFTTNTFGLTSIITAPLTLIQSLLDTGAICNNLRLPLPYLNNQYLELPCMYSIYRNTFGVLFTMYQTITYGIIAYWVCVRIFNLVKDFKNPEHDEIEVLDL